MKHKTTYLSLIIPVVLLVVLCSFRPNRLKSPGRNRIDQSNFPQTVLWVWERPENLEFIDPQRFAVAFLAQTLVLKGDEVVLNPRRQPLKLSPETRLIAVTRIESQKLTKQRPLLSEAQKEKVTALILKTLNLKNVSAVQVDFDAAKSERDFYQSLLKDLRERLPENVALSMTALASFCVGDRWLSDLPVDEAVPMIFRMGADDQPIKRLLAKGNDFREPLCRRSYGVSLDEPIQTGFELMRRRYVFNPHAWTEADLASLSKGISK
ncbi:MAG: DUF3142 domain-containing protein [Acidobacteriota bacterium]